MIAGGLAPGPPVCVPRRAFALDRWAWLGVAALLACGDARESEPDAGPAGGIDGATQAAPDAAVPVDSFAGSLCEVDADCASMGNPWVRICVEGICEECAVSDDCADNPDALGPHCDLAFCMCAGDADCSDSGWGRRCHLGWRVCSCEGDGDCGSAQTCREQDHGYFNLSSRPPPRQCFDG